MVAVVFLIFIFFFYPRIIIIILHDVTVTIYYMVRLELNAFYYVFIYAPPAAWRKSFSCAFLMFLKIKYCVYGDFALLSDALLCCMLRELWREKFVL